MSLIFTTTFVSVVLLGCQSEDNATINTDKAKMEEQTEGLAKTDTDKIEVGHQLDEGKEKLELDEEIIKVNISTAKGTDTTIFDDDKSIEIFNTALKSAVKVSGIANMANPEFYMDVVYKNEQKQSFHLWVGKKGEKSTLMKVNNTSIIYAVSEDITEKLIDLIES